MTRDLLHFRKLLLAERARLRHTLEGLGHVHPDDAYDFDASSEGENLELADEADRATQIEEFSSRVILEAELEKRYQEIHSALLALADGSYGVCVFCGKNIPRERLEANPAARTCIEHMQSLNETSSRI